MARWNLPCNLVCLSVINTICPLANVASFGDIAIISSEQLGIESSGSKKMISFFGESVKNINAIRYRDVLLKANTEAIIIYWQCRS